jgi:hypothetical protein
LNRLDDCQVLETKDKINEADFYVGDYGKEGIYLIKKKIKNS